VLGTTAMLMAAALPPARSSWVAAVAVFFAIFVLACETGLIRVPGPKRQVGPSLWRRFGPRLTSFVWGIQLGFGLTTRVASFGIYALVIVGWIVSLPLASLLGLSCFGIARGLQPLLVGLKPGNGMLSPRIRLALTASTLFSLALAIRASAG